MPVDTWGWGYRGQAYHTSCILLWMLLSCCAQVAHGQLLQLLRVSP